MGSGAAYGRHYRPDVEGLRAVAVLLVLLVHFAIPGFSGGFIGVDVFFVISGFVITGLLRRERERGRIRLGDFFARRCRRIIPVSALVLVLTVVVERIIAGKSAANALVEPSRWILLFVFNWNTQAIDRLLLASNPLNAYWTLSVEEQFYLVFPFLLIAIGLVAKTVPWRAKAAAAVGVASAASFSWSVVASTRGFSPSAYVSTLSRAWELGLGCLLVFGTPWFTHLQRRIGSFLAWAGLGMIVFAGFTVSLDNYPGWSALAPAIGAALVIAGGTPIPEWGPERVLVIGPVRRLGQWSYGAYLWQIPVLVLVTHWRPIGAFPLGVRLAFLAAPVLLGGLSFAWFESPIRHSPALIASPMRTFSVAIGITAVALVLVGLVGA